MAEVLVLNVGSSSVRFAVFEGTRRRLHGQAGGIGGAGWVVWNGAPRRPHALPDHGAALAWLAQRLEEAAVRPVAVGHRVVHGGPRFEAPVRVDEAVLAALETLVPLAPLHQPPALAAIREAQRRWPAACQVACFDTAFHRAQPPLMRRYALPRDCYRQGVQVYGFHGLSYESVLARLPALAGTLPERLVIAHLGAGCSLCAVREGRAFSTTMGMTPLDGLPMATRCGQLDPGVVLYWWRSGMSYEAVEEMLYRRSGWLGVSEESADMETLLASERPAAQEAVALFCQRVVRAIGAAAADLGGIDALVFTGAIGAGAAAIRARILEGCGWLGFTLDAAANAAHGPRLTTADSRPAWALPSDEEGIIARHTHALCQGVRP